MSRTILLADDSLTIQKVVELTFADTDYRVIAVSNGDELLKRLSDVRPDLIICDVIMPGRDGYDVCQQIKSDPSTLHIPVILLTGTFEPFDKDRAVSAGCSEIVTKPFEARRLVETVEKLAREAELPSEADVQEERETLWDAGQYEGAMRPPAAAQPPVRATAAPAAPWPPVVPAQPLADEFATQVAQGTEPEPAKRPPFTAPIRLAEVGAFEEVAEAPAFEEVGSPIEMEPAFEEAEPVTEPAFEVGAPPAEPAFEETPLPAEPAFEEAAPAFEETPLAAEPVFEAAAPELAFEEPVQPTQPAFEQALEMEPAFAEAPAAVEPAFEEASQPAEPAFEEAVAAPEPVFEEPMEPIQPAFEEPLEMAPAFEQSAPVEPAFEETSLPAVRAFEEAAAASEPVFEEPMEPIQPAFEEPLEMAPAFEEAPVAAEPAFEESAQPSAQAFEETLEPEPALEEVPVAVAPAVAPPAEPAPLELGEVSPLDDTLISRRRAKPPVETPAADVRLPEYPSPVTAPVQPVEAPVVVEVTASEEPATQAAPPEDLVAAAPAITWPAPTSAVVSPAVAGPAEAVPTRLTLADEDIERIARRVLELSRGTLEQIAWEVIPDMAEVVVRERVRQLEAEAESVRQDNVQ